MLNLYSRIIVLFAAICMTMGLKQKAKPNQTPKTPVLCSRPALDKLGLKWLGSFPGAKVKGVRGNQPLDLSQADLDFKRPLWIPFKHITPGAVLTFKPATPHVTQLAGLGNKYGSKPFIQKYVPGMDVKLRGGARSSRPKGRGGRLLLYFFDVDDDEEEDDDEDDDMTSPETCFSNNCVVYRNKIYDMENQAHVYQLSIDIDEAAERYEEGIVWLQFLGYQKEMASEIYEIFDQLPSVDYDDDDYLLF